MASISATKQDLRNTEAALTKNLKSTEAALRKGINDLGRKTDKRFEQVDECFDKVERKMERLFAEANRKSEDRFDRIIELSHINAMESMKMITGRLNDNEEGLENMRRAYQMLRIKVADNTTNIAILKHASK